MKAFPQKYPIDASEQHHWVDNPLDRGMDLRDYFASKVLPALLFDINSISIDMNKTAKLAYAYADAMMEARK
jgi:hypothetical protein